MKKKNIIFILMSLILIFSLFGCDFVKTDNSNKEKIKSNEESTEKIANNKEFKVGRDLNQEILM